MADLSVHTVLFGVDNYRDLYKKAIYPVVHINPVGSNYDSSQQNVITLEISALDQRDLSNSEVKDKWLSNDNQIDTLNTCHAILNRLIAALRYTHNDGIEILSVTEAVPVLFRELDLVDGWLITITLAVPNTIDVCVMPDGGSFAYTFSPLGFVASGDSCSDVSTGLTLYSFDNPPLIGTVLYSDVNLTVPFLGNNLWRKASGTNTYQIDDNGIVMNITTCSTLPANQFNFSQEGKPSGNDACGDPHQMSLFSTSTVLQVGSKMYTDFALQNVFVGNTFWYKSENQAYLIDINGNILEIFTCSAALFQYNFTEPGTNTALENCNDEDFSLILYSISPFMVDGITLFTDFVLSTPFPGGNLFYKASANGVIFQIDNNGLTSGGTTPCPPVCSLGYGYSVGIYDCACNFIGPGSITNETALTANKWYYDIVSDRKITITGFNGCSSGFTRTILDSSKQDLCANVVCTPACTQGFQYNVNLHDCNPACNNVGGGGMTNQEALTVGMWYFDPVFGYKIHVMEDLGCIGTWTSTVLASSGKATCAEVVGCPIPVYGYNFTVTGHLTSGDACADNVYSITLYSSDYEPVLDSTIMYTDTALITPFTGGGLWYHNFNYNRAYHLDEDGTVLDSFSCPPLHNVYQYTLRSCTDCGVTLETGQIINDTPLSPGKWFFTTLSGGGRLLIESDLGLTIDPASHFFVNADGVNTCAEVSCGLPEAFGYSYDIYDCNCVNLGGGNLYNNTALTVGKWFLNPISNFKFVITAFTDMTPGSYNTYFDADGKATCEEVAGCICTRPTGLTRGALLGEFTTNTSSDCGLISSNIRTAPNLAAVCDMWATFKDCVCVLPPDSFSNYDIEYSSIAIGQKLYASYGSTSCSAVPLPGFYFFWDTVLPSSVTLINYFCPITSITIVTVGADGIITALDTCTYTCARPIGLTQARLLADFNTSAASPCGAAFHDIRNAVDFDAACALWQNFKNCACAPFSPPQISNFPVEYSVFTPGEKVYVGYGLTNCAVVPEGRYFFWDSTVGSIPSLQGYLCPLTHVSIINIDANGEVISLDLCTFVPPPSNFEYNYTEFVCDDCGGDLGTDTLVNLTELTPGTWFYEPNGHSKFRIDSLVGMTSDSPNVDFLQANGTATCAALVCPRYIYNVSYFVCGNCTTPNSTSTIINPQPLTVGTWQFDFDNTLLVSIDSLIGTTSAAPTSNYGDGDAYGSCGDAATNCPAVPFEHILVEQGVSTSAEACPLSGPTIALYSTSDTVGISTVLYTDNTLTTPFNGGGFWYRALNNEGFVWQILSSGAVNDNASCSSPTLQNGNLLMWLTGTSFNGIHEADVITGNVEFLSNPTIIGTPKSLCWNNNTFVNISSEELRIYDITLSPISFDFVNNYSVSGIANFTMGRQSAFYTATHMICTNVFDPTNVGIDQFIPSDIATSRFNLYNFPTNIMPITNFLMAGNKLIFFASNNITGEAYLYQINTDTWTEEIVFNYGVLPTDSPMAIYYNSYDGSYYIFSDGFQVYTVDINPSYGFTLSPFNFSFPGAITFHMLNNQIGFGGPGFNI